MLPEALDFLLIQCSSLSLFFNLNFFAFSFAIHWWNFKLHWMLDDAIHIVRWKCVTKCGWAQFAQAAMESQFAEALCAPMPLHFSAFHVLLFYHVANMTRKIKPNVCEVLDSFPLCNPVANSTLTSTFDLFNPFCHIFDRRWKMELQLNWSSRKLWNWQSNSLCRKKKELKSIIFRRTKREKFAVLWVIFISSNIVTFLKLFVKVGKFLSYTQEFIQVNRKFSQWW